MTCSCLRKNFCSTPEGQLMKTLTQKDLKQMFDALSKQQQESIKKSYKRDCNNGKFIQGGGFFSWIKKAGSSVFNKVLKPLAKKVYKKAEKAIDTAIDKKLNPKGGASFHFLKAGPPVDRARRPRAAGPRLAVMPRRPARGRGLVLPGQRQVRFV